MVTVLFHEVDGAHADLDVEDLSIVYNSDQKVPDWR